MNAGGKTTPVLVTLLGIGAVAIAAIVLQPPIVEQWYIWHLDSGTEETRDAAAKKLGQMRSVTAIPRLVRLFRADDPEILYPPVIPTIIATVCSVNDFETIRRTLSLAEPVGMYTSLVEALVEIGPPAIPALAEAVGDENYVVRRQAISALSRMAENTPHEIPRALFTKAAQDEDSFVRDFAIWNLLKTATTREALLGLIRRFESGRTTRRLLLSR